MNEGSEHMCGGFPWPCQTVRHLGGESGTHVCRTMPVMTAEVDWTSPSKPFGGEDTLEAIPGFDLNILTHVISGHRWCQGRSVK